LIVYNAFGDDSLNKLNRIKSFGLGLLEESQQIHQIVLFYIQHLIY
jgi:hypothetical protein